MAIDRPAAVFMTDNFKEYWVVVLLDALYRNLVFLPLNWAKLTLIQRQSHSDKVSHLSIFIYFIELQDELWLLMFHLA